jgi:OOP family OmpA-OmpF porin
MFMDRIWSGGRRLLAIAALMALTGCASSSAFDQLNSAQPTGTPFQMALFGNYAHLAWSYAPDPNAPRFSDIDSSMSGVADAFATKAMIAAQGHDVAPEAGITPDQQTARTRLTAALDQGRNTFPADAARAQADFDCWVLNSTVPTLYASSARCRGSFAASFARFERNLRPVAAAPPPMPAQSGYTAYFGFDSWALRAEDLAVLQQAVSDARAGGQSHISVVGHTDTVGSARYNMKLSKKRANVVKDALVDMGARRAAIVATGVGKSDLAVPTGEGVNEPKNRRAVVTLEP